jgi:hypothetical protein
MQLTTALAGATKTLRRLNAEASAARPADVMDDAADALADARGIEELLGSSLLPPLPTGDTATEDDALAAELEELTASSVALATHTLTKAGATELTRPRNAIPMPIPPETEPATCVGASSSSIARLAPQVVECNYPEPVIVLKSATAI